MSDKLHFQNIDGRNTVSDNHGNQITGQGVLCGGGNYVGISENDGNETELLLDNILRLAGKETGTVELGDLESPLNRVCSSKDKIER